MGQLLSTWLGLGALGAGIVHLAVAAGSPPVLLGIFVVLGVAETGWGVSALARPRLVRPQLAVAGALLPVAVWLAVLLSGSGSMSGMSGMATSQTPSMAPALPTGAMLGATALDLLLAVGLAIVLRSSTAPARSAGDTGDAHTAGEDAGEQAGLERPWRFLAGVLVGAAFVAVVTANSLAATPVGAGGMTGMGH